MKGVASRLRHYRDRAPGGPTDLGIEAMRDHAELLDRVLTDPHSGEPRKAVREVGPVDQECRCRSLGAGACHRGPRAIEEPGSIRLHTRGQECQVLVLPVARGQRLDLLGQAKKHYPDSVALSTIEDQIKEQRDRLMNSLVSLYKRYIDAKKLVKTTSGEDLTTVIPVIKRVDPKHYLLKDKALADLYLSESEKLIAASNFKDASTYIVTGLKLFPEDSRLQSLNQQINAQTLK